MIGKLEKDDEKGTQVQVIPLLTTSMGKLCAEKRRTALRLRSSGYSASFASMF